MRRTPVKPFARASPPVRAGAAHGARDRRSCHGSRDDTEGAGRRERHPPRHVPRREAHERVEKRQRQRDETGLSPSEADLRGQQHAEQHADCRPEPEVQRQPSAARQDGMHRASAQYALATRIVYSLSRSRRTRSRGAKPPGQFLTSTDPMTTRPRTVNDVVTSQATAASCRRRGERCR